MESSKYTVAGWMAITGAIMLFPEILMGLLLDIKPEKFGILVFPYALITVVETSVSVFALVRFKQLLNERFNFHRVDMLILVLVFGGIIMTSVGLFVRTTLTLGIFPRPDLDIELIGTTLFIMLAIPMAVVGIVFGVKLLNLEEPGTGLVRPMAFVYIGSCICMATMILMPFGIVLLAAFQIMMGLLFLRNEEEIHPEFV